MLIFITGVYGGRGGLSLLLNGSRLGCGRRGLVQTHGLPPWLLGTLEPLFRSWDVMATRSWRSSSFASHAAWVRRFPSRVASRWAVGRASRCSALSLPRS